MADRAPAGYLYCPACNRPDAVKVVWEYKVTRGCACTMCGAQITIHIPLSKEQKRAQALLDDTKLKRKRRRR